MRDHIILDLSSDVDEREIKKLKDILMYTGGIIDISEGQYNNHKSLIIKYETNDLKKTKTRNAGRKKIGTAKEDIVLRIGDVKQMFQEQGLDAVLSTLHISRATYFRRWKSLRERGYSEDDNSWNQRFFI